MIQQIFNALSLYLWSILIHEIGHYFYLKRILKKDAKIILEIKNLTMINMDAKLGVAADYDSLNKSERYETYLTGIITGLIVIGVAISYNVIYLILLPAYLWSCIPDIKNMWSCIKK